MVCASHLNIIHGDTFNGCGLVHFLSLPKPKCEVSFQCGLSSSVLAARHGAPRRFPVTVDRLEGFPLRYSKYRVTQSGNLRAGYCCSNCSLSSFSRSQGTGSKDSSGNKRRPTTASAKSAGQREGSGSNRNGTSQSCAMLPGAATAITRPSELKRAPAIVGPCGNGSVISYPVAASQMRVVSSSEVVRTNRSSGLKTAS